MLFTEGREGGFGFVKENVQKGKKKETGMQFLPTIQCSNKARLQYVTEPSS